MDRVLYLIASLWAWIWTRPPLVMAEVLVPAFVFVCLLLDATKFRGEQFFSRDGLLFALSLGWILFLPALRPMTSVGLRPQQRWAICGLALLLGIFSSHLEEYTLWETPYPMLIVTGFWLAAILIRVWK